MFMPAICLYDSVQPYYFQNNKVLPAAISALHQVNDATIPLHTDITIRIKPYKSIAVEWKDKIIIQRSSHGNSVRKAVWENGWFVAKFSDFGTFQVFTDLIPPQINEPVNYRVKDGDTIDFSAANRILFTPTDNFGIKEFKTELNGHWLRFTNDKSRNWIYQFDERCPYGVHELKVIAEDLVGNITTKTRWFKRYPYTPPPPRKKILKKKTVKKKIGTIKKPVVKKKK